MISSVEMLETVESCIIYSSMDFPISLVCIRAVGYLMRGRFETVERWSCYLMLWGMLQGASLPRSHHLLHFLTVCENYKNSRKRTINWQVIGLLIVKPRIFMDLLSIARADVAISE